MIREKQHITQTLAFTKKIIYMHFYVQGQIYSMIIFQELLSPFKTNALVHSQNSKKLKEVLYVTVSPQLTTEIKTSSELTELCLGYSAIFTPFFDTYNEI